MSFSISSFLVNKTTKQTVIRNGLWRTISIGSSKIVRVIAIFLAARWLGPAGFGDYSYVSSVLAIAFLFSDWGVNVLLSRDVQQKEGTNAIFSSAFVVKLSTTFLSTLIGISLPFFVGGMPLILSLFVIFSFAISNIREIYISLMTARQRGELETLSSLVEGVATIVLIGLLFFTHRTPAIFALTTTLGLLFSLIFSIFLVRKYLTIRFERPELERIKYYIKSGLPLAFFGVAGFIFFSSDQLFVKYFFGVEQVGYYSLATRVIYAAILIPNLIVSVLFPVFARMVGEKRSVHAFFQKGFFGLLILGGVSGILIFLAEPILLWMAPQYSPALPILNVLVFILIFLFPSLWSDFVLIAFHKQRQDFFITIFAAALNLFLNLLLIPILGILGAAYASIISQVVNTSATYVYATIVIRKIESNYSAKTES